jgi:hypothetical protein
VVTAPSGVHVEFLGEDGSNKIFPAGELPLHGWYAALAAAFAERVGPTGGRGTLGSVTGTWQVLRRFVRFLADLGRAPHPQRLTAAQGDA